MLSKKELLLNLKKDLKQLDQKVNHPHLYNASIKAKKTALGVGMAVFFVLPSLVGAVGAQATTSAINMDINKTNIVSAYEEVGTISTSNGYYAEERIIANSNDFENKLSVSTGWHQNEVGNYERYETELDFSNFDLSNPAEIFAMSQEELKSKVNIINQSKIEKNQLNSDDEMYNEDVIIVNYHYTNKDVTGKIAESSDRKTLSALLFIMSTIGFGFLIKAGLKLVIKKLPSERLKEKKNSYVYITEEDIKELKELYQTKKENYEMLVKEENDGPTLRMMK